MENTYYKGQFRKQNDAVIEEILSAMKTEEKIQQMVMVDLQTWKEFDRKNAHDERCVSENSGEQKRAFRAGCFGGVILFAENCRENDQTLQEVKQIYSESRDLDVKYPVLPLVAADQEGGTVTRLGQGTRGIGNMALAATDDPRNARSFSRQIGMELRSLGINTDFGLIADINTNPENPVIGVRAFSDDPHLAAVYGTCFLEGLKETGTITAVKHFPGHGDVNVDSHTGFPAVEKNYAELKSAELIPFQAAVDAGVDMVMTAHIQYPLIEKETYRSELTGEKVYLPATLSRRLLTQILREEMRFEGVVVSDSLIMAAMRDHFPPEEIWLRGITAGIDLFLMPFSLREGDSVEKLESLMKYGCAQVENGTISVDRIDSSVRRILRMKQKYGLLEEKGICSGEERQLSIGEGPGSTETFEGEWKQMQKAVTLLKNVGDSIPLQAKAGENVLLLYASPSYIGSAEAARIRLVKEGLLSEEVVFRKLVYSENTRRECLADAATADYVIAVTAMFSPDELNPGTEKGAASVILDEVLRVVQKQGKKVILISANLPYDAARFTGADAILAAYGAVPMKDVPKEGEPYSANICAAICAVFGEFPCSGILPVDIPKMDESYRFTDEVLFPRGYFTASDRASAEKYPGASILTKGWQARVVFPDQKGVPDDTLAMNCMYSFFGYHGQGRIYIQTKREVTAFQMYMNGIWMDTTDLCTGEIHCVDISGMTKDGENTIQISNIEPFFLKEAVTVYVPYPMILPGSLEEGGINGQAMQMISDLIECDIENGFTSAQLAVIRNGRLVYENAWGKINSYLPDGSRDESSPAVTTDTLYDLASVTKMVSVNYAVQKLVSDGKLDLDAKITDFFGKRFAENTVVFPDEDGKLPSLEKIRHWKEQLSLRDLLWHQGGFPADPAYSAPFLYRKMPNGGKEFLANPLFAGNAGDEAAKNAVIEAICRTPLEYEPGTKTLYSDVDYMVLGLIVEKVTGENLNTWLKKTFWEPMSLTRITYNPLKEGFSEADCAATELCGNTRDHLLDFPGYRSYPLRGEVHDEKAFYNMQGISGHAGLFANARDLAKLASVMLCGGYGEHRFFSRNVIDQFTAPKKDNAGNWGLGWWRQGEGQRAWCFGTQAGSGTIGHQGWTGTMVMIDPVRNLVVAYLTNRINSPVTDAAEDPNMFDGNWYTASTLGFVPQILSLGMEKKQDLAEQLLNLSADMVVESLKHVPEKAGFSGDHPSVKNVASKRQLFERIAERCSNQERIRYLRELLAKAVCQVCSAH